MGNDDLEVLYIKYNNELYIYALSLCKNHHLAQDLVSETFFKALLSIEISDGYIKYWLFRVCKNLFLDHLKKNSRLEDIEETLNKLSAEDNTLVKIIFNEDLNLQPSYKEIIILYYYCNLSLKEISEVTGVSQGAARTLLFRARKKLKEFLEEDL